jgi:thymidylate kinase
MASVTLIGPDGAGKTTLTRRLEASGLLPFRYLYMGVNIAASNVALPTARLAERLKMRSNHAPAAGGPAPSGAARTGSRARIRALARLGNRLADEWFRQLVSWSYQLRGFVVLYDRHFVFDFAPEMEAGPGDRLDRQLHRWCLTHLYPRPGLVIFLDAPGEVLFARKGESTVEELERRRQAFLRQGKRLPNFVRVDATRPLEEVYSHVEAHVMAFCGAGRPRATPMRTPSGVAPRAGS